MSKIKSESIDFDVWFQLALKDPEAFERKRKLLVEATIENAPVDKQERLRCLQWRIDRVRDLSSTPMSACIKISRLMWDNVVGSNGLLENLQELSQLNKNMIEGKPNDLSPKNTKSEAADVLPFPIGKETDKAGL